MAKDIGLREVLLIGNGFDLAHGLHTSYEDFLSVVKDPDSFSIYYYKKKTNSVYHPRGLKEADRWDDMLSNIENSNMEEVYQMLDIFKNNSWAQYYANCNAEIDGWVDFEREMIPALNFYNYIVNYNCSTRGTQEKPYARVVHPEQGIRRMAHLWPKYIYRCGGLGENSQEQAVLIQSAFSDITYGVKKKQLLKSLLDELDEFEQAFEIYLREIAMQKPFAKLPLFENMKVSNVISFNYTPTFLNYPWGLCDTDVCHVHGSISEPGSIIFGVNKVDNDAEYLFKEYEKAYQRLTYNLKPAYKRFLKNGEYNLTIFGHSLDVTDEGILNPAIKGAKKTTIYYRETEDNRDGDKNSKIKNLMILLGDKDADEMLSNGRIRLKPYMG